MESYNAPEIVANAREAQRNKDSPLKESLKSAKARKIPSAPFDAGKATK